MGGVRQAAKERKQEQFTALLHHLNVDLLRDSFYALKRQAAPGVDGVTWKEYENGLEGRLADLHSRVHRGAYRAQPSRRVYIPKADGRQSLRSANIEPVSWNEALAAPGGLNLTRSFTPQTAATEPSAPPRKSKHGGFREPLRRQLAASCAESAADGGLLLPGAAIRIPAQRAKASLWQPGTPFFSSLRSGQPPDGHPRRGRRLLRSPTPASGAAGPPLRRVADSADCH